MKKLFAIVLSIITLFSVVGCSAPEEALAVDTSCWGNPANPSARYEKCVYKVEKVNAVTNQTVATGTLTYTVDYDHTAAENNLVYSSLTADFTITYTDEAAELDRGKTDTVFSKTVFLASALTPAYSEKTVTLANREGKTNESYLIKTDYAAATSTLDWTACDKPDSTLSFSGESLSEVYDNETLYYTLRAFNHMKSSGSVHYFKVASMLDCHLKGKFEPTSIKFSTNAEGYEEALTLPALSAYLDEAGSLMAITATVSVDDSLSGPPIEVKYSATPFKTGESSSTGKVMVSLCTTEYDITTQEKAFVTKYTLDGYSVVKEG